MHRFAARRFVTALGTLLLLQGLILADHAAARGAAPRQVRSRFTVTVPSGDAELSMEGTVVKGTGTRRVVQSAPLEQGKEFEYTFSAKWWPNGYTHVTRTKSVRFVAGKAASVDLSFNEGTDRAEVRYIPTPEYVVTEMVKLAGIRSDDVVYELGCGDARTTIAAIRAGARKGVGIDIDAARVADSQASVKAAGLADRVEIRQGDALDVKDLSDATVVFLYMGDEFNLLLRPILWRQLKLGARVVSHQFTMGDWPPEKSVGTDDLLGYAVHLWTITSAVKERATP
jgi:uncharacterized protein (TIGR03000 family)